MGGELKKGVALVQGLLDKLELIVVEIPEGLLEVTHTAVDQLRRPRGRARREVLSLDQGYAQSCTIERLQGGQERRWKGEGE